MQVIKRMVLCRIASHHKDSTLESLSVDSNLCRRAPSCLHRGPAGFQSCTWTFPGSPLTFRFPPSTKKKAPDGSTGSLSLRPSSRTSHSWYNTHHVGSVDGRGHLDFPEVLAVCELLGAADGSCAAAVVRVKTHLPVVAAEEGAGRLEVVVPLPVKTCCGEHTTYLLTITFFFLQIILVTLTWTVFCLSVPLLLILLTCFTGCWFHVPYYTIQFSSRSPEEDCRINYQKNPLWRSRKQYI